MKLITQLKDYLQVELNLSYDMIEIVDNAKNLAYRIYKRQDGSISVEVGQSPAVASHIREKLK